MRPTCTTMNLNPCTGGTGAQAAAMSGSNRGSHQGLSENKLRTNSVKSQQKCRSLVSRSACTCIIFLGTNCNPAKCCRNFVFLRFLSLWLAEKVGCCCRSHKVIKNHSKEVCKMYKLTRYSYSLDWMLTLPYKWNSIGRVTSDMSIPRYTSLSSHLLLQMDLKGKGKWSSVAGRRGLNRWGYELNRSLVKRSNGILLLQTYFFTLSTKQKRGAAPGQKKMLCQMILIPNWITK